MLTAPTSSSPLQSTSAGGSATSAVVTVTVDNDAPVVTLADPGTDLRGTVSLGSTSSGDTAQVTFERRPSGGGAWTSLGTDASSPFTNDFDTTAVADGLYELRAVALDGSGNTGTSAVRNVRVDNTAPSGSITAPAAGATVGGVVSVQASASDTRWLWCSGRHGGVPSCRHSRLDCTRRGHIGTVRSLLEHRQPVRRRLRAARRHRGHRRQRELHRDRHGDRG